MYLVISGLKETWPEKEPFWLFHSGCCPDYFDKNKFSDKRIEGILPDPFGDGKNNCLHYEKIWNLSNELISILYERLNHIHGVSKRKHYWEIHLGFWVLRYVLAVYDRLIRLEVAKTNLKGLVVQGLAIREQVIPKDSLHFVNLLGTDLYNVQLISSISENLSIEVEYHPIEGDGSLNDDQPIFQKNSIIKQTLKGLVNFSILCSNKILRFINKERILMESSYFPRWFELTLNVFTLGKISRIEKKNNTNLGSDSALDSDAREYLSQRINNKDDLLSLLVQLVGVYIPKSFVEDFSKNLEISKEIYKDQNSKFLFSTVSWISDDIFLHFGADSMERGSILLGGEHGGAPFLERYNLIYKMESVISDYYFTWGWSDPKNPKAIPTPANKLIGLSNRKSYPTGDSVLYVCASNPRYSVSALEDFERYLNWQSLFFKTMNRKVLENFIVRSHFIEYGWCIRERIHAVAPNVKFDNWNFTFNERLAKRNSRLYVFDYLSTTFIECLASNLPSVLFFDRNLYPLLDIFNSDFEMLKKAKIFHDTPESASEWINEVYDNANVWFYEKECQDIVAEFLHKYGRRSKSPLRDWINIFNSIPEDAKRA
ncbi:LIC12162 family transferase [Leptospira vanthielii]|uniref:Transferase n=1 Tax=Leptospira vanthielii TaxID=293085 RepID=A0ABY2NTG7_9LEPT|nr:LIC12162 family protein [Leptospira vanthielii]TGM60684.1 hypothetical protein EHQ95_02060 [Leptospira vanthielii]